MARSRVKGAASLRRLLKRLPNDATAELRGELVSIGNKLLGQARAETPTRTGRLRSALRATVTPKTLMLKLGLVTKATQRRFFYGYILDQGRAAKTVTIRRGPRAGKQMRISPIPRERYNFVFGRRKQFIAEGLPALRRALDRILTRASKAAGSD